MEVRPRAAHRRASPERAARVWAEPLSQKPPPLGRKVSVVYYLCRNRHLEHPHFIEVPLASPLGLYLRDVIDRLNVLRGKGMAAMYSWSCKRSYKNGFVWHDISEDDLILPAHGDEYVLKGSELVEDLPSGRIVDINSSKRQTQKLVIDNSSRGIDTPSSSSSTIERPAKLSQQERLSPPLGRSGSSEVSPEFRGSPLSEYKVYKPDRAANAATQTDSDGERRIPSRDTCTRGVSTEEGVSDHERRRSSEQMMARKKESPEIRRGEILPSPPSSTTSSGGKTETLESLIRADVNKMKSFRILEEEQVLLPTHTKLKPSNVLMQLITCGSITVKDHHSFGLVPTYRPKFLSFPSPTFTGTTGLGELDWLPDNPRLMGLKLEEKEYFSGSLIETGKHKGEDEICTLKRSNSYNAERTSRLSDSTSSKEESGESVLSKCIPLNLITASNKSGKTESAKSPLSEKPRNSVKNDFSHAIPVISSGENTRRATSPTNSWGSSKRLESCKEEKDKLIKIEESLLLELGLLSS